MDQTREPQDRILTLPNLVTLIRLLLIPIFVYLSWSRSRLILGGLLLGLIGATDWIDGYLARRLNQTSTVGKVIDPSADRLLLIAAGIV
ncbi:MAG: CDP-alcohol phosphatidyltransferase family protein, partial [Actinomycetota bacterium]|nr:CDP-alcohol phosphatidyltransferase family protein [Actinomycetota bacterium]